MQFQVQTLVKDDNQSTIDELDIFVGLKTPLNSPYNIFLRLSDIESNNNNIYFYAYSMGKERAMIWGIYEKTSNTFLLDNACNYHPNDLKSIIETWKNNKYQFFFTSMRNRMTDRIEQFKLYGDDRNNILKLVEEFKKLYLGKSSINFNESRYVEVLGLVYTAGIKAMDENKETLELLYNEIDNQEDTKAIKRMFKTENLNDLSKSQLDIGKHIIIHLFIMTFLTIDDYRSAKYILHIDSKQKTKLMKELKGTFVYEWLIELGKILRIYDIGRFMVSMSKNIVKVTESKLNMNTLGVIGGPPIQSQLKKILELISITFEDFISKSEYSKISYINKLIKCPSIEICDENNVEGCDLYRHGNGTFSKHDLL